MEEFHCRWNSTCSFWMSPHDNSPLPSFGWVGDGVGRCSDFCWGEASDSRSLMILELPCEMGGMVKQAACGYIQEIIFWTRLLGPTQRMFEASAFAAVSLTVPVCLSYFPMTQPCGSSFPFPRHSTMFGTFEPLHTYSLHQFTWGEYVMVFQCPGQVSPPILSPTEPHLSHLILPLGRVAIISWSSICIYAGVFMIPLCNCFPIIRYYQCLSGEILKQDCLGSVPDLPLTSCAALGKLLGLYMLVSPSVKWT